MALLGLAGLATSTEDRPPPGMIPLDCFYWLPASAVRLFTSPDTDHRGEAMAQQVGRFLAGGRSGPDTVGYSIDRSFASYLAKFDRLNGERSLRIGWLFVAGTLEGPDRKRTKVFWPLVSRSVRIVLPELVGPAGVNPVGDTEITTRITDRDQRHLLEEEMQFGGGALDDVRTEAVYEGLLARLTRLTDFAYRSAHAAGAPVLRGLVPADAAPEAFTRRDKLVVVAGVGVYADTQAIDLSQAGSLRSWARIGRLHRTAFHALYAGGELGGVTSSAPDAPPPPSPFELTPVQREAVKRSRTSELTVVKGAPGTGKSHTITAIACDALARNKSVLVAARSDATVDALIELFERVPGPQPVVFGSNERKDRLASELEGGLWGIDDDAISPVASTLDHAVEEYSRLHRRVEKLLEAEQDFEELGDTTLDRALWPGVFAPDADLDSLADAVATARAANRGWRSRRAAARASRALRATYGLSGPAELADLAVAIERAAAARDAARITATGGLDIGPAWQELLAADAARRDAAAAWLAVELQSPRRRGRTPLATVSTLATALRSGRAVRRHRLAQLDRNLTLALPLWVGTLADIDDLLPAQACLFDLVIIDEASSVDQPSAAPALLRGRQAVIVGDPKQLRHVSFTSDEKRDRALTEAGIDPGSPLGALLDVRRNSIFDVAVAASPPLTLDEHFRCKPHLVQFVAHRLYDNQLRIATRSPGNQSIDCVDVIRLDGERTKGGVVEAEVEEVVRRIRGLIGAHSGTVGVVSPFRAQADALEKALLEALTFDEIEQLDLRVGTVHGFQGIERDLVLASVGIGAGGDAASWRFVQDPHLFTVFVTRARKRFVLVHSADPPSGGLFDAFLAQADTPPAPPTGRGEPTPWTSAIGDDLRSAGLSVVTGYPTGRHLVDLCVGDADDYFGVECGVHPAGPEAHIDRHLSLMRRGWTIVDAYPSRWHDRRGELVVELTQRLLR